MKKTLLILSISFAFSCFSSDYPSSSYSSYQSYTEVKNELSQFPSTMLSRLDRSYEVEQLSIAYQCVCVPNIDCTQKAENSATIYFLTREDMLKWSGVYMEALENNYSSYMKTAMHEIFAIEKRYYKIVFDNYWDTRKIVLSCGVDSSELVSAEEQLSWDSP